MQVQLLRRALLQTNIAGKDSYIARRLIAQYPHDGEAARGKGGRSVVHLQTVFGGARLQFKISETALHHHFRTCVRSLLLQNR